MEKSQSCSASWKPGLLGGAPLQLQRTVKAADISVVRRDGRVHEGRLFRVVVRQDRRWNLDVVTILGSREGRAPLNTVRAHARSANVVSRAEAKRGLACISKAEILPHPR